MSRYWEEVRALYSPFESGPRSPAADLYELEMPGGQYTNLFQQAKALGLAARWHEVCKAYTQVNQLFGDIIKVTPSSKVVGDMALFVVANNLTPDDVLDPARELAFPESVVEFFEGRLGQPPGGFPPALQARVLKGRPPLTKRPGANLAAGRYRRRPRESHRPARPPGRQPRCALVICSIRASSPTWPPTSGSIPTRRSCPRRSSSSVPTRRPSTWSRSSRARR